MLSVVTVRGPRVALLNAARRLEATVPPVIKTARLDLVPLQVAHTEEMAVVLADPALHTYIGGAPDTVETLRTRYQRMTAGSPDPAVSWLNWVIRLRADSGLAGTIQATVTGRSAEIAWVVGMPWQGRGIATEAARGLVGWLTRQPDHHASARVAASAGLSATEEWQDGEVRWRRELPGHGDCAATGR